MTCFDIGPIIKAAFCFINYTLNKAFDKEYKEISILIYDLSHFFIDFYVS